MMVRWWWWCINKWKHVWKFGRWPPQGATEKSPLHWLLKQWSPDRVIPSRVEECCQGSRQLRDREVPRERRTVLSGTPPPVERWNIEKNNNVSQDNEQQQKALNDNIYLSLCNFNKHGTFQLSWRFTRHTVVPCTFYIKWHINRPGE